MEVEAPPIRCNNSASASPEFEFWMVRNPSFPPPNLLSADELILDGVLLPLQLISLPRSGILAEQLPDLPGPPAEPSASPSSILCSSSAPPSVSRRWKDLFKAAVEKKPEEKEQRKMERRSRSGGPSELNISLNIWPFTRSRSAGGRPRSVSSIAGRKASSAPCSRSNSSGEADGGLRGADSTGRGAGAHLGRPSTVWQLRRAGAGANENTRTWIPPISSAAGSGGSAGVRVLNLNVNSCIGYGKQVSSGGDDGDGITEGSNSGGSTSGIFSLKGLFWKKVY